jgi:N-acetylglucosamine-6-sulfatase
MTRRQLLSAAAGLPLAAQTKRPPNFVFLFSDDHHFQCLGANGNPHIRTPNLDRLAARGVNFGNGQISTPQCAPSRGVMMTGLETYQNGLLSNGQTTFKPDIGPTAVEQLRRSGYETALFGKWHTPMEPSKCGFSKAPLWFRGGSSQYRNPSLRRGLDGAAETVDGHITDLFTDAAIDYARGASQPFLLWLAYNAPHSPLFAADKYRVPYEGKTAAQLAAPYHPPGGREFDWLTYYSVITHLDEAIGRLVTGLEKAGVWDNTVLFFVGDNGFMCGTRNWNGKVLPWEESVRVPFLASGGLVKGGVRSNDPVASIDVTATWLDLAGVRPASPLSGRSLRSYLETGKGTVDEGFSVWADGRVEALAVKQAVEPYRLVRTRTHKYILWESKKEALFELSDNAEARNLAESAAHRKTRNELRERLSVRMKRTGDPAAAWL